MPDFWSRKATPVWDSRGGGDCPKVDGESQDTIELLFNSRVNKSFKYLNYGLEKYLTENLQKEKHYLGILFFGSSLSLASPPKRYTLLPMRVKLCPSRGHGNIPFLGAFGFNFFHSHRLACEAREQKFEFHLHINRAGIYLKFI